MSMLEKTVAEFADALENLEKVLAERFAEDSIAGDDRLTVQRHVRSARENAAAAAEDLQIVIAELREIVATEAG